MSTNENEQREPSLGTWEGRLQDHRPRTLPSGCPSSSPDPRNELVEERERRSLGGNNLLIGHECLTHSEVAGYKKFCT